MLFKKGEGKGACPFRNLKDCSEKCVLYRKGVIFNELRDKSEPFEDCAFNIMANNMEAMHQRLFGVQKEMGETKNATLLKILVDLGMEAPVELERQFQKMVNPPESSKQIGE